MAVFHLAFGAFWQRVATLCILAFFFVDLAPEAIVAEDVATGEPLRVVCKNALADRTFKLAVHLLEELKGERAERVIAVAALLLGWDFFEDVASGRVHRCHLVLELGALAFAVT
jgi:hypothetical protein